MEAKYLLDCYTKEFETTVKALLSPTQVILEETYFYPTGGGQPNDEGIITVGEKEYKVIDVKKFDSGVIHVVDSQGIQVGDSISCHIDWNRRYRHMRYHTGLHILSDIITNNTGAMVTGNQLTTEKARVDFSLEEYNPEEMEQYVQKSNDIIMKGLPIRLKIVDRSHVKSLLGDKWTTLAKGFPEHIKEVRLVDIEGFGAEACGGTHVKNTQEIGELIFIKAKSKGKNNRRIEIKLKN
jgi:misacylated tRNA(Ala) deacylase